MLKRCTPVLNLYCKNNLIEKKTIDIFWRFSMEKHEAISQQIQNILVELSKILKKSERDYIYSKILTIPKSKFDISTPHVSSKLKPVLVIYLPKSKNSDSFCNALE